MSVAIASAQAAFCASFVDELLVGGVSDAVICPGSRSTPLALALAASPLRCRVRLDERSAGFFALGLARATDRPVLVLVTSGTAAAELHAAVTEAQLDRVPILVATADRPPELRRVGAAQTIVQEGIFGAQANFSVDPGPLHALPRSEWRPLAGRLLIEARGRSGLSGPVHVNLPFVEPLLAEPDAVVPRAPDGGPWFRVETSSQALAPSLATPVRGVIVAGRGAGEPTLLLEAAARLGWPVLADPRSGCRRSAPGVVATADGLLRDPDLAGALEPELIVLAGAPPASKVLGEWIASAPERGVELLVLGSEGPARHPSRAAARFVEAEPAATLAALSRSAQPSDPRWTALWDELEDAAQASIAELLELETLSEPGVARLLSELVRAPAQLVCSSSMPIRDLEWFGALSSTSGLVHANRGANGIDGVVSTAMGVASSGTGPVVCLVGDLAFLHDVSALVDGVDATASLTIVVLDNRGGGIFSFLPQRAGLEPERFEQLFGTPPTVAIAQVARGFGLEVQECSSKSELAAALDASLDQPGIRVLVAELPSRDENVDLHATLSAGIAAACLPLLG